MTYKKVTPPDIAPVKGRTKRNRVKPTTKIKKFYNKATELAQSVEPEKAIRQAVNEVYQPTASIDAITSQTGLQILIKEFEAQGLTPSKDTKRMIEGLYSEDKSLAIKYEGLYYRLKYPEAFRSNINVDNRKVTVYDNLTTEQLAELVAKGDSPPPSP